MNENFNADEKLYRAVIPSDMFIKEDGSLSSAAYKSHDGCSVDRGNGRDDQEAADFMLMHLKGNIYSVEVSDCESKDIFVKYEPTEGNIYHSELYKNTQREDMTKSQCRFLAQVSKLIRGA